MTEYQKTNRPDLAILDALWRCKDPISLAALWAHVNPHEVWISKEALESRVKKMVLDRFVALSYPDSKSPATYSISHSGRAHLVAEDALLVFGSRVPHVKAASEPISVSICDVADPPSDPDDHQPAVALLRVDEDELNDWWDALDVEAKADAFVQWSLGNYGRNSHIYIEPREAAQIPVAGAIGGAQ